MTVVVLVVDLINVGFTEVVPNVNDQWLYLYLHFHFNDHAQWL